MVERNEVNAIIVHGTMCLIRRTAMEAAGGWSSDTICEDSDLGLTIMELRWRAHYTNRRYGWGLLPQDYLAFTTQRARWAGGDQSRPRLTKWPTAHRQQPTFTTKSA
jgi:cellulose synthase/poly-beta-1,6-N-acetylglucosamine synthase-like glycosyltransferase